MLRVLSGIECGGERVEHLFRVGGGDGFLSASAVISLVISSRAAAAALRGVAAFGRSRTVLGHCARAAGCAAGFWGALAG